MLASSRDNQKLKLMTAAEVIAVLELLYTIRSRTLVTTAFLLHP